MNRNNLAPNNDRKSETKQGYVTGILFLEPDKQLSESVDPGMSDFNDPASWLIVRIAFNEQLLFTTRTDMRYIHSGNNFIVMSNISRIKT